MSRYAHQASTAVVGHALETIANKESQYKEPILDNHVMAKSMAETLAVEGQLEQTLLALTTGEDAVYTEEFVQSFLEEQRNRLKKLAEGNYMNERNVTCFIEAVQEVRKDVMQSSSQHHAENDNDGNDDAADDADYGKVIQDAMEKAKANMDAAQGSANNNMYIEICERMGQPVAAAAAGKDDDDEDIAIVPSASSMTHSLKCPVTGTLCEDPVKNTVCNHVYSRAGIMNHIRMKKSRGHVPCPVPGCTNRVTEDQLVKDVETEFRVKRSKRNQQYQTELIASQAAAVDESEDEETF